MRFDTLWRNARLATLDPSLPGLGIVESAAIGTIDGRIAFVGPHAALPSTADAVETIDLQGRWVLPGFVDCHTHIVYAGNRAVEFQRRLAGVSYAEIAASGGGILSTVRATRSADEAALVAAALPRLDRLLAEGVTTIEAKSGYGLEAETELRQLRAARRLERERAVKVITTYLGAHAVPPDMGRADYLDLVCGPLLDRVAREGLADAVDAFCEGIAFSAEETDRLFTAAGARGLPVKLHAEQLSNCGGCRVAARHRALSVDHIEYADDGDVAALATAGTVAVLLPGAFYTLRESRRPPVAALRAAGVPMAVATDCNPGSSPLTSILLAVNMGCTLFGLTVEEAIAGATREAARALGRLGAIGTLEVGKACDLSIWQINDPSELAYAMGLHRAWSRVVDGTIAHDLMAHPPPPDPGQRD